MAEKSTITELSGEERIKIAHDLVRSLTRKLAINVDFQKKLASMYRNRGRNKDKVYFVTNDKTYIVDYSTGPNKTTLKFCEFYRPFTPGHADMKVWSINTQGGKYYPSGATLSYRDSRNPQNSSKNNQATVEKFNELLNQI